MMASRLVLCTTYTVSTHVQLGSLFTLAIVSFVPSNLRLREQVIDGMGDEP